MKKQYKIQLPKGKKVTMTNVNFEDGVMTVNVELENQKDFHKAMHDEVCGLFSEISNHWKEILKANCITREKIEKKAMEDIKKLEKNCPDIWDRMIQEYGEAICGKKEQKYEPKDGDFVYVKAGYEHIAIFKKVVSDDMYIYASLNMSFSVSKIVIDDPRPLCCIHDLRNIRPATEREKKLLIDKLAEINKKWNAETKQIENVRWRAEKGNPYYYIIGWDTIVGTTDERLACDDSRYCTNNYFKTHEVAEKTMAKIREIFKKSKAE